MKNIRGFLIDQEIVLETIYDNTEQIINILQGKGVGRINTQAEEWIVDVENNRKAEIYNWVLVCPYCNEWNVYRTYISRVKYCPFCGKRVKSPEGVE